MQTDSGKAVARELCLKADVVLEYFRPGVMKRLGLDYQSFAADNPRLVYASMSGFGADGPDSMKGAFDLTIQAVGGYMNITGERGGAPIKMGTSAFDVITGTNCYAAVLAALLQRTVSDRKSTRLNSVTNAHLVCSLQLEKKKKKKYRKKKKT